METENIGPSFPCTLEEFKHRVASFSKACPTLNEDQLENGMKAVALSFIGLPDDKLTLTLAHGYLDWANKHYMNRLMELSP